MRFSSHEIKQQKFKKKMRGLDPEEVEVFVQMVAEDFAEFEKENQTLKNRMKDCKLEIEALRKSEAQLKKALAEKNNSAVFTEEAEKKGMEIILQAKRKAEEIRKFAIKEAMAVEREIQKLRGMKKELKKEAGVGEGDDEGF